MAFRAAACTGALYHIELYLVCGALPDLEAGVYQFGVHDMALRQLRHGDYRSLLVQATGGNQAVAETPVTLVYTSTYWRNAWKYQARTYRHCFWDSGTILANTLTVASALNLPARVVAGFLDDEVNLLLDLDSEREVALSLVPLGFSPARPADPAPTMERLNLATAPLSATAVDYPAIRAMHTASSLTSPDEVAVWRDPSKLSPQPAPAGALTPLSIPPREDLPWDPIEKVIARRGSSRHFEATPISFEALSTILEVATGRIPADFLNPSTAWLNDIYLIVNAVDSLASGAYLFRREQKALELLKVGDFRQEAGYLDLGQALAADAAVNVYFLADLGPVLERFGNRGYRAAQLEASITAGKMYLASYALGLGATGLTFFDDDVTNFFSPHAQGKSVMFLLALGRSAGRRSG
jgi:SagB-type dehydrogenase family enzyme